MGDGRRKRTFFILASCFLLMWTSLLLFLTVYFLSISKGGGTHSWVFWVGETYTEKGTTTTTLAPLAFSKVLGDPR